MEGKVLCVSEDCIYPDSRYVGTLTLDCSAFRTLQQGYLRFKSRSVYEILIRHPELTSRMVPAAQLCIMSIVILGLTGLMLPRLKDKTSETPHHATAQLFQQGGKLLDTVGTQI